MVGGYSHTPESMSEAVTCRIGNIGKPGAPHGKKCQNLSIIGGSETKIFLGLMGGGSNVVK